MYSLTIDTEPTAEPITLTEVKNQLRITTTDDDAYLKRLIKAARMNVENVLGRSLMPQTWNMYFDRLPADDRQKISLLKPPIQSVTWIKYYDNNDVFQTWDAADYVVDTDNITGLIYPGRNKSWPQVRDFPKSVQIQFVAGYASANAIPSDIKHAILLIVGHLERNRETTSNLNFIEIPIGAHAMLAPYKIWAM